MDDASRRALDRARAAARALAGSGPRDGPRELAFVTCSYDTAHEPVERQVREKLDQLLEIFPADGPIAFSLTVVDDAPADGRDGRDGRDGGFGAAVARAFASSPAPLLDAGRLALVALPGGGEALWGRKGLALRFGMAHALALPAPRAPDVVVYVNLNLKVDARQTATGLRALLASGAAAAIGSRAPDDGGAAIGAGRLGRVKSRAWSGLVRAALRSNRPFADQNAPLKLFSPAAARAIVEDGRIDAVGFDCEWLAILSLRGLSITTFPLVWVQRAGSRPPWGLVPGMMIDLARVARRLE